MDGVMFGILVVSGLCHFSSSLHHRQYNFVDQLKTWSEAQGYCREKHTDLATINDNQDLEVLAGLVTSGVQTAFVGLYRHWTWSRSEEDDYKEGELSYWRWANGEPKNTQDFCANIGETGEWFANSCPSNLIFFCYKGNATGITERFVLEKVTKDWLSAQFHCRKTYTDLAWVRNEAENLQLQEIAQKSPAWIGLTGKSWMWSDGSEAFFIPWQLNQPNFEGIGDCAALQVNSGSPRLTDVDCMTKQPFYCYSVPRTSLLVRLKMSADGSSVDMKDPFVLDSILKQLERKLKENHLYVKLSWRKFPVITKESSLLHETCIPLK